MPISMRSALTLLLYGKYPSSACRRVRRVAARQREWDGLPQCRAGGGVLVAWHRAGRPPYQFRSFQRAGGARLARRGASHLLLLHHRGPVRVALTVDAIRA